MEERLDLIIELIKSKFVFKAVLDLDEAAEYANISRSRLSEIVNSYDTDFPYFRNGRKILINRTMLDAWLEKQASEHNTL